MAGQRHTAAIVASYLSAVDDGGSDSDEWLSSSCSDANNEFEEENEAEEEYLDDPGNSSTSIDHVSSGAVINSITSMSNTSNACSLVAKKNTKSDVWRHFGLRQIYGRVVDKPVCRECFSEVRAKPGKGASPN